MLFRSSVYGNIFYNWDDRNEYDVIDGFEPRGRTINDCVGSPPPDTLDKRFWNISGLNLVIDDDRVDVKEDRGDGTTIRVYCPPGCMGNLPAISSFGGYGELEEKVEGTDFYTDESSICASASHAGALDPSIGGFVKIKLEHGLLSRNMTAGRGTFRNGIQSSQVPYDYYRLATFYEVPQSEVGVQTISGHPSALLEPLTYFQPKSVHIQKMIKASKMLKPRSSTTHSRFHAIRMRYG